MRRNLKSGTILLLIVFVGTVIWGAYVDRGCSLKKTTYSISQKSQHSDKTHAPYNLYAQMLKEIGTDKYSQDDKSKLCVRHIVDFNIMQILTKSYVATNTSFDHELQSRTNAYYIFALRKIVV